MFFAVLGVPAVANVVRRCNRVDKKKAVSLAYSVLLCSPCCLVVQFRFRCLLWQNPLSGAVKSTLPGPREGSSV